MRTILPWNDEMDPRCGVEWCHIAPITGRNIFTNVCTPKMFARIRLHTASGSTEHGMFQRIGGKGGDAHGYAVLQDVSEKIS